MRSRSKTLHPLFALKSFHNLAWSMVRILIWPQLLSNELVGFLKIHSLPETDDNGLMEEGREVRREVVSCTRIPLIVSVNADSRFHAFSQFTTGPN